MEILLIGAIIGFFIYRSEAKKRKVNVPERYEGESDKEYETRVLTALQREILRLQAMLNKNSETGLDRFANKGHNQKTAEQIQKIKEEMWLYANKDAIERSEEVIEELSKNGFINPESYFNIKLGNVIIVRGYSIGDTRLKDLWTIKDGKEKYLVKF
jgi:hypothetical protein